MKPLRQLLALHRPHSGWLLLGILLSYLTLMANIGLMALSGWFITAMGLAGAMGATMNYFSPAAGIRGLAILRTAGRYGERVITHEATFKVLAELRTTFYRRLEPLVPAALDGYGAGDLFARISGDIDTLDGFYLRILAPLVVATLATISCVAFLAWHLPALAALDLVLLLFAGASLPLWIHARASGLGQQAVHQAAELRSAAVDGTRGLEELLVFGADQRQAEDLDRLSTAWLSSQERQARLDAASGAAIGACANLALWVGIVLAVPLVRSGQLPPAHLVMLALFSLAMFEAVAPLPAGIRALAETRAAAQRVFGLPDVARNPGSKIPTDSSAPAITVRDVDFRHNAAQTWLLREFNMTVEKGERVALLGASGTGKSTLVELLTGLRFPQQGEILVEGLSVDQWEPGALHTVVAVGEQDAHLFNGTIADNLRVSRPEATDAELSQALSLAQLAEFTESLPDGLRTWIGETGQRLSGGQRRRLSIARALLEPTPILIVDEPTEGLDRATAGNLMRTLTSLAHRPTLLVIAHDQRLLPYCDRIVELGSA